MKLLTLVAISTLGVNMAQAQNGSSLPEWKLQPICGKIDVQHRYTGNAYGGRDAGSTYMITEKGTIELTSQEGLSTANAFTAMAGQVASNIINNVSTGESGCLLGLLKETEAKFLPLDFLSSETEDVSFIPNDEDLTALKYVNKAAVSSSLQSTGSVCGIVSTNQGKKYLAVEAGDKKEKYLLLRTLATDKPTDPLQNSVYSQAKAVFEQLKISQHVCLLTPKIPTTNSEYQAALLPIAY